MDGDCEKFNTVGARYPEYIRQRIISDKKSLA